MSFFALQRQISPGKSGDKVMPAKKITIAGLAKADSGYIPGKTFLQFIA
jgi:hypothetical protein